MKLTSPSQGGIISILLLSTFTLSVGAAPQRNRKGGAKNAGGGGGGGATGNGLGVANAGVVGAAPIISQATDGSTIMDKTVMIKWVYVF